MPYKLLYLGYNWPDAGRIAPEGAQLEIHKLSDKWVDLVFLNKHGQWQYVSTLPIEEVDINDIKG